MEKTNTTYPNPDYVVVTASTDRVEGAWVEEDGFRGIVTVPVAQGKQYLLKVYGKVTVTKDAGVAFAKGAKVVFSNGKATEYSSGNFHAVALEDVEQEATPVAKTSVDVWLVFPALSTGP